MAETKLDWSHNSVAGLSPAVDVMQDTPAGWDWRVIVAFTVFGIVLLYFL